MGRRPGGRRPGAGRPGRFLHVRRSLCVIWRLGPPGGQRLLGTLLNYALAVLMVLCIGLLLLLSLAASTALPVLVQSLPADLPGGGALWHWLEAGLSFALLSLFFALVFRVMSGRRIAWGYVAYGAVISARAVSPPARP